MSRKRRHNNAPKVQATTQTQETKPSEMVQTETEVHEQSEPEAEASMSEAIQTPMSIPPVTPKSVVTVLDHEGEVQSIQRTVAAEANAVLASNRKRDPVVTLMPDGTQRIDF